MRGWHETAKVVISVRPDRREGALVGYGLQASKIGVADRIDGYLVRTPRAKFHLPIALPPSEAREAAPVWGDQGGSDCRIRSLRRGGIEDGRYVEDRHKKLVLIGRCSDASFLG